ncbi:protein NRT1/ PTR FAMILY 5.10 [Pyrus x bretschneideri]|uniref:protein NRT1/ PTR FAMILY 5.10 n=1 Tax=Pyrus x bretschneideri TaxID=225117 RepID=UPI00202FADE1|nr:protein NRT1/ PTR FAMILY 5.10 [Pyrus x bretschneideri]
MAASPRQSPERDAQTPLLDDVVDGAVDHKGRPVHRSRSGGWRSARFIIGVEVAERFAYYGIGSNLITFLTGPLGQSTATAAENVNIWSGTASLLPLLGAFVADSFLGRYRTIVFASLLYILGLGLLTLSAVLSSSEIQVIFFFFSLYLVAVAQGGHKPCVQAFGADQFDVSDPEECKAKSSFFNWWYFGLCAGTSVTLILLTYIQDNLSWGLGFGIPCIAMVFALSLFLLGTRTYRYSIKGDEESPFVRIGNVFVAALRNRRTSPSAVTSEEESRGILPHKSSEQFKFLNKALLAPDDLKENRKVCTIVDVEDAKAVLRLFPIWVTCLAYAVVFAQYSTFFTKQGATMDRTIVPGFNVPAASLQTFISFAIVIFLPIYDRIFVPIARSVTGKPAGITMLQRIGTGMVLSIILMVIAALVEMKRLKTAKDYGLLDMPSATVPMSIWWLVPQYLLAGIADVFTMVGLQEFFYDQVPNELRSVGLALYLSIFGVGSFLSSFLISVVDDITSLAGESSWFSSNLNRAHLDYFYWLLGGISLVQLVIYLYFAKSYIYKSHDL